MIGEEANLLLQIMALRYERGSMILPASLTFDSWDSAFTGLPYSLRLCSIVCFIVRIVSTSGESCRLKGKCKAGVLAPMRAAEH
jgi:DNA replication protein DnaC